MVLIKHNIFKMIGFLPKKWCGWNWPQKKCWTIYWISWEIDIKMSNNTENFELCLLVIKKQNSWLSQVICTSLCLNNSREYFLKNNPENQRWVGLIADNEASWPVNRRAAASSDMEALDHTLCQILLKQYGIAKLSHNIVLPSSATI